MFIRLARFLVGLCAVACAFGAGSDARAAAFTLKPGELKLFVSGLLNQGDRYFDAAGKLRSRNRFKKSDLQVYAEYGLLDGLTLFGSSTLERIEAGAEKHEGLGRSEIGLRARVFERAGWIASVQGSAVIAGAKGGKALAVVGETDDQFDVRGLVARSFQVFGKPAFMDFQTGYRARTGDPADEFKFESTFGIRPVPKLLLMAQSFNTIGLKPWRGPYPLRQRIAKLQGTVWYDLTQRLSVYVAGFMTPYGFDAVEERGGVLGVGLHF